ncbi:MAG: SpoIIE family protein phosphatase [Candidatus Gracilibacteria bacterium]|jgi:hypothetical protein
MSFLRKSLFAETALILFFNGVISALSAYLILTHTNLSGFFPPLPLGIIISADIFFVLTILTLEYRISRPLHKIIKEMRALISGEPYTVITTAEENELGFLAKFFNEITHDLENIYTDVKSNRRIKKELNSAEDIQRLLIPKSAPVMQDLEITAKTRPASEIGGDTFDFYSKNGRNILYIGDSTGHGIPAGIVMVMVDVLLETFIDIKDSLREMMITLNHYIKPHLKPTMFMTMMLLEWIPADSKLKWIGAGHEYLLWAHTGKGSAETILAGGIAIGMIADNSALVGEKELALEENDFVILYSDGITEAKNPSGQEYGLARLKTFVESQATPRLSSDDLFQKISMDVGRFTEGAPQLDDMTLIVLKHTQRAPAAVDATTEWRG